ncbi:MAG: hypothetical protein ACU0DI_13990 [Paracoccaceae bacterium]
MKGSNKLKPQDVWISVSSSLLKNCDEPKSSFFSNPQFSLTRADVRHRTKVAAIIRTLVDKIVLAPAEIDGKKTCVIDLHGQLAGILSLASNTEKPLDENEYPI